MAFLDAGELGPFEARNPNMGELPSVNGISDLDLMTEEDMGLLFPEMSMDELIEPFDSNLAERLDEDYLRGLGQELLEKIQADDQSRSEWKQRFKRGLQIIGLSDFKWDEDMAPFEGASTVVHPMLVEAGLQSQARAFEELFPAQGPVKTLVMGRETREKREAADRVAEHMNYQLTVEDPVYGKETSKLHLYNTWFGCAYRKAYHDPLTGRNVLRFIKGEDMIFPYSAKCLEDSPRITHEFQLEANDLRKYQLSGAYRDIELQRPDEVARSDVKESIDEIEGKEPTATDDDEIYTIYETDCYIDLQGYEDVDAYEMPTGLALPYTVSIEKDSGKILAIRRCWKPDDQMMVRRTRYAEYIFVPGLGMYGLGLLHLIGSLASAATDSLRALLDSASFANLQGGFKAKDAGGRAGQVRISPGTWRDIDMTGEELQNSFYTPPFKEPSEALFKLLGFLTEMGQRVSATTDLMVGEGTKGPVGTTIAMLEQGQKVYSSVHKRGHQAVGIELKMLAELNAETIPEEGYPYLVPGNDQQVFRKDYDQSVVSVVPVSDPNIFSTTQRIAQNQALYQLWKENETRFRGYEVLRRTCEGMKIPDIDDVLIDIDNVPMMSAPAENAAMMTGRPVLAKEQENHEAHMAVHMSFMMHPQFGGNPQVQQVMMPAMVAHLAEHLAFLYIQRQREIGVPMPPVNLAGAPGEEITPPEAEQYSDQLSQMAAAFIGKFMQTSGLQIPPQQGEDEMQKAQLADVWAGAFQKFGTGLEKVAKVGMDVAAAEQGMMSVDGKPNAPQPGAQPQTGAIPRQ